MGQLKTRYVMTEQQKMMVFILSMSLFGMATMVSELLPELKFGLVEFKVEYFLFIPLSLAILFHPLHAAVGAALGRIIFGEIMLGQFEALGEIESFLGLVLALYVAGIIVRDPSNKKMVGFAALLAVVIDQFISMGVDIGKVWIGVEEFEAVPGLIESIVAIEGFAFLNDVLFSGILFAMIPTMYLVPKLYGKIEPLLGMKPKTKDLNIPISDIITPNFMVGAAVIAVVAFVAEAFSESEFAPSFEWAFAVENEILFMMISLIVASLISILIIWKILSNRENRKTTN
ncbi:hypothetical protein [Marinilactibacillus kalidii]|uniref:hypothetical protein n=1 Tax=Marinilactibacillus kalidii TaxID=2820274 RepID=UPI001ABEE2B4|nr:hypothetical protein [Marinilactibacillus kalidii]